MTRPSSWLAAIFFLAAVTLGYLYLRQRVEMGLIRAEMAEKSFRAEQDHRQIADYQKKLVAANDAAKKAEEELTAQDREATARTPAVANRGRVINMNDIARDHPEYADLQRKQLRRSILRQYGDALSALNLAPEQLAQLKDLLASRVIANGDPRLAGLTPGTPAYNQATRAASAAVNAQITDLIGPDGQAKLRDAMMTSMAETQIANNYAPDFQDAGVALTPEQTRSLAQLMSPARMIAGGAGQNQADPATGLSPNDEAMLEQAAQILSPAQVAILKTDRSDQGRMNAIMQAYVSPGTAGGAQTIISGGTTIITNRGTITNGP